MHPIVTSKEDRGWKFGCDDTEQNLTFWRQGAYVWFYHNEAVKYNEKSIIGRIMQFIRCYELGNRDIIIVLCENSIELYPAMLDSIYDIISNTKKIYN
jgi:hypothetical protein